MSTITDVRLKQFNQSSKINIFKEGWDDNCEDDADENDSVYLTMSPITSPKIQRSPADVENLEKIKGLPQNVEESDDDDVLYDDNFTERKKQNPHRSRSRRIISTGGGKLYTRPNKEGLSLAGLAAKKYLLKNEVYSKKSSPKNVGSRGIKNRIDRNKTNKVGVATRKIPRNSLTEYLDGDNTEDITTDSILLSKRKSKTLDKNLNCTSPGNATINFFLGEDDAYQQKQDGAGVIRMIGPRSKSLDGKFLEYLAGVADHTSRSPSITTNHTDNEEEEEDFQKYAQSVAAMSKSASIPNMTLTSFVETLQPEPKGSRDIKPSKTNENKTALAAEKIFQKQEKQRKKAEKMEYGKLLLPKSKSKSWDRLSGSFRSKGKKRPPLSIAKSTNLLDQSSDDNIAKDVKVDAFIRDESSTTTPKSYKSFTLDRKKHKKHSKNSIERLGTAGKNVTPTDTLLQEFDGKEKSSTLSKVFGRRFTKSQGNIFTDNDAMFIYDMFSGSIGRRRSQMNTMVSPDSPSPQLRRQSDIVTIHDVYFKPPYFCKGFRLEGKEDSLDEEFIIEAKLQNNTSLSTVNKYATITGSPHLPRHKLRRQISQPKATFSSNELDASHLTFSEALLEGEELIAETDLKKSPLRPRKLQKIQSLLLTPSEEIFHAALVLYRRIVNSEKCLLQTHNIVNEKEENRFDASTEKNWPINSKYQQCAFGHELVTFLCNEYKSLHEGQEVKDNIITRSTVCGMWQALLEEGALEHVRREHHFQDENLLYRFSESVMSSSVEYQDEIEKTKKLRPKSIDSGISSTVDGDTLSTSASSDFEAGALAHIPHDGELRSGSIQSKASLALSVRAQNKRSSYEEDAAFQEATTMLKGRAPDALFRMVLRKQPEERKAEELMMIYEEILHIKALAHLTDSVKRELAAVLKFEFHRESGKTLFKQGDEGRSWYIIVKGAVDVVITGKGVVCTLHEGDDFGNLAIINEAPRAATIILAEENCQLLRVDKLDFVRILKDVEANTVRLKEHDNDVLILQKIQPHSVENDKKDKFSNKTQHRQLPMAATPTRRDKKYAISAGTPSKIVEHIVESLSPWSTSKHNEEQLEDLILMHKLFMSTQELFDLLLKIYKSDKVGLKISAKRQVIYFIARWSHVLSHLFYEDEIIVQYIKKFKQLVNADEKEFPSLKEELGRIYSPPTKSYTSDHSRLIAITSSTVQQFPSHDIDLRPHEIIKSHEHVLLKVFNLNHTYTTVKLPCISSVRDIISAVAEKQGLPTENLILVEVQSDGDKYQLQNKLISPMTSSGLHSRLFICKNEEKELLKPLNEQININISPFNTVLESASSFEIAQHITQYDWELINSVNVMEFIYKIVGSHKFGAITCNIDMFARRFNQLAYWVPTEICLCTNANKRVHLLRRFIKIAQYLKELQNMNAFLAVMIGIGNRSVTRMTSTWDKIPAKYKKLYTEFEAILDPSRNHRSYRHYVANMDPPFIPYLPLLMKDMTFQHEGNDTVRDNLINFEKMHMISNSIRSVVYATSKSMDMDISVASSKLYKDVRQYTRKVEVITDQTCLNKLSLRIEPKK